MEKVLFEWLLQLPYLFGEFTTWLTTPLDYINVSPLTLFSVAGVSVIFIIITMHLIRLFVGG